jgi:hypothetical protein
MKAKSLRMQPDFKHRTEDWGVYLSDIRRHSTDAAVDKLCAKHWDSQWDASIESIKTYPDRWLDYRLWKRDTQNPRFPDFKDNDGIMEPLYVCPYWGDVLSELDEGKKVPVYTGD